MPDSNARSMPRRSPDLWLDMDDDAGWYYTSATSMPVGPVVGQKCFRTDIRGGILFRWDGTYWLSEQRFTVGGGTVTNVSSQIYLYLSIPSDLEVYIDRIDADVFQNGGATATNYALFHLSNVTPANGYNTVAGSFLTTQNTTLGTWIHGSATPAYANTKATYPMFVLQALFTLAPTGVYYTTCLIYRLRAT